MAEFMKTVHTSQSPDGFRRLETHVEESVQGDAKQRITTYKEEVIPMEVKKVVRETVLPVVTSRKTESYDRGTLVDTQHEFVPEQAMQLVENNLVVTPDNLAAIVENAIQKTIMNHTLQSLAAVEKIQPQPTPTPAPAPQPAKFVGFEISADQILYSVLALLAASILYITVLKGWILN